jgi:virulence-associated protein VapD
MFAIAFDLIVANAEARHPRGSRQAYLDIESTLKRFGFERVQMSVFESRDDDLATLFSAIMALRAKEWFGQSVKDVRAFRVERGADFTTIVKGQ